MSKRKARLDKNKDAKPLTEIVAVFPDNGQVIGFPHQVEKYIVRGTDLLKDEREAGRREVIDLIRKLAAGNARVCVDEGLNLWILQVELVALAELLEERLT